MRFPWWAVRLLGNAISCFVFLLYRPVELRLAIPFRSLLLFLLCDQDTATARTAVRHSWTSFTSPSPSSFNFHQHSGLILSSALARYIGPSSYFIYAMLSYSSFRIYSHAIVLDHIHGLQRILISHRCHAAHLQILSSYFKHVSSHHTCIVRS